MLAFRHLPHLSLNFKNARAKHELPSLAYGYEDLEPIISRETMMTHHCMHHRDYVNNLNKAEEELANLPSGSSGSQSLQSVLHFNSGGHVNHSIFWKNLTPLQTLPSYEISRAIECEFESFQKFKEKLARASIAIQGSGWGWLGCVPKTGKLEIRTCANQDTLLKRCGLVPLFGIDVWEHAYYLQYKSDRAGYVNAIFDIINWVDVSARFAKATKTK